MEDQELKDLAKKMASNYEVFAVDHPYINHLPFLELLREEYAAIEQYEVASIIADRITILTSKQNAVESIVDLVSKIQMLNEIQKKKEEE